MKSPYFCAHHAKRIKANETDAFCSWSEMMHRGVKAFTECRIDTADIYLNAAFDITIIRASCDENTIFKLLHSLKPVEFLIQLEVSETDFESARNILSRLQSVCCETSSTKSNANAQLSDFISKQNVYIERMETDYLNNSINPTDPFEACVTGQSVMH